MRKKRFVEEILLPEGPEDLPLVELSTRHQSEHPWIFRRMLGKCDRGMAPGTLVEVHDKYGEFIGRGFFNPNSEIALRLLTMEAESFPGRDWFKATIGRAVSLRRDVLRLEKTTDSYRLIHSEGDGISGLIADKYGATIVLQLFSAGIHRHLEWIQEAFLAHYPDHEIIVKSDFRTEKLEGVKMDGPAPKTRELVIQENKLKLNVDLRRGHKTGYFLDQRENRFRVYEMAAGHTVFDGFCYSAGFGLSAALGGAKTVESVDLDEDAVEIAEKNKELNQTGDAHTLLHGNVFDVLRDHRAVDQKFSLMILDPAKLAFSKDEIPKAMSAYADMNRLGMQCLQPGGVLLSCSCTGLVSEEDFLTALRAAAAEARMEMQVLGVFGAPGDHPFAMRVPEGRYLKSVFSRITPLT